jgi:hypothetical protein
MNNDKNTLGLAAIGCLSVLALAPILLVLGVVIEGYVVMKLWAWFVAPLGIATISYLHAAGIATLWNFLTPPTDVSDLAKTTSDKPIFDMVAKLMLNLIARPVLVLWMGSVIHHRM